MWLVLMKERPVRESMCLFVYWLYHSESSALSSALSSSPSRITSLRATCDNKTIYILYGTMLGLEAKQDAKQEKSKKCLHSVS